MVLGFGNGNGLIVGLQAAVRDDGWGGCGC